MTLRWCGGLAIALLLGCTGSNPAFDAGTTSGADDEGAPSSGPAETGSRTSEDSGADDVVDDTGVVETSEATETTDTDTDPTGGTCSAAPPMKIGSVTSADATRCPSEGFIRGHVLELNEGSFQIIDCGDCSFCPAGAPTWTVTIPAPLAAELLTAGECVDVFYDCEDPAQTALRNLALMQGPLAPVLAIGSPALPLALGGWEPAIEDGEICETDTCPENTEMRLAFLNGSLGERENGRSKIIVGENEIELDVSVRNAHYDAMTCEPVVVWIGKE